ncbi:MAG: anti-sigma factor family protein [Terracidiphilus sp.]
MNGCNAMQTKFTEYLDGRLSGREMQSVAAHLEGCPECAGEWKSLAQVQSSLAALGPAPVPEDLLLRINVAISHERARRRQSPFHALNLAWRNTIGPFLLQASAGFASAVLLLGTVIVLVGMFAQPESVQATADEPLGNLTAPHFLYLSSVVSDSQIGVVSGPIVIEAYVNGAGQVYDYRIISGPTDEVTRGQVEDLLLWSRFEPARRFGQPISGLAVLSFSGVSVRG